MQSDLERVLFEEAIPCIGVLRKELLA